MRAAALPGLVLSQELEAAQEARMLETAKANAEADRLRADHGNLVRRLEAAQAAAEAAAR